ncbi:9891_t:CDS:1, partial [Racocetra fulgida]
AMVGVLSSNKELEFGTNFELAKFEVDDSELGKFGKLGGKKKVVVRITDGLTIKY